ncbi:hypothetical protein HCA58_21845 [Micromonospora sp. HNM0581]|uniref:hypothetical protein n=1 Tax=Micromonospora sp. HNM0581 TaxID=2716341 RepID=UPI00146B267C|nr:hypothetical protein [Micromonospora sp. HNM0581]NLU80947.1 hypothetical protein [Micromonospora sp. HNM0581]
MALPAPAPDDDWTRPPTAADPGRIASFAGQLAAGFAAARRDGLRRYGFAEEQARTVYLASTGGARRRHAVPRTPWRAAACSRPVRGGPGSASG